MLKKIKKKLIKLDIFNLLNYLLVVFVLVNLVLTGFIFVFLKTLITESKAIKEEVLQLEVRAGILDDSTKKINSNLMMIQSQVYRLRDNQSDEQ